MHTEKNEGHPAYVEQISASSDPLPIPVAPYSVWGGVVLGTACTTMLIREVRLLVEACK